MRIPWVLRTTQTFPPGGLWDKRGEVTRVRTTVLQAHSHQWLGTFGGPGTGDYRGELARALDAILSYAGWLCMPLSHIMIRLDGLYGNGMVLKDLVQSGVGITVRCKDYGLLDLPLVQTRLQSPPDHQRTHEDKWSQSLTLRLPRGATHSNRTYSALDRCDPPISLS
ncbi:hypothetical protein KSF_004960 [Reticulibacter mediterranei]|uniref:Transposase DDE domain-containing protein n=1 Tax=Reticulibacter mediterranei TaxID=2778369 RepID=A0A8J3IDA8_9CHLR|nr:hypothetical protein [Reticulibacter mediterranei]GHO90448.1 hypothetical protein KSF_004960 [Reticulibacter mediterranei]